MDHSHFMRLAMSEARKSTPKPTNYCVGAVLVDPSASSSDKAVLATGYTLELPGNTHAEQCCLQKLAAACGCAVDDVGRFMPSDCALYTTMEPCNERLSGNLPCVDRILQTRRQEGQGIRRVYVGVMEPEKFVGENKGRAKLVAAGILFHHVLGFEDEILDIATAGHDKE